MVWVRDEILTWTLEKNWSIYKTMDGGTNCTWEAQPPVAHISALFTLEKELSLQEEAIHGLVD